MSLQSSAIRYLLASAFSFAVNLGLTVFVHEVWGAGEEAAFAIALLVVFVINFFALRYYIYEGQQGRLWTQFWTYTGSAIGFRLSEYCPFLLLHSCLRIEYRVVVAGVMLSSFAVKFFYYRYVFERASWTHTLP